MKTTTRLLTAGAAAVAALLATVGTAFAVDPNGTYEVHRANTSGPCLAEYFKRSGGAPLPGFNPPPRVKADSCVAGSPKERWRITPTTAGFFLFVNVGSGRCLDWSNGSAGRPGIAETQPCNAGRTEQNWTFDQVAADNGRAVVVRNGRGARALQAFGGDAGVSTGTGDADGWRLVRVG